MKRRELVRINSMHDSVSTFDFRSSIASMTPRFYQFSPGTIYAFGLFSSTSRKRYSDSFWEVKIRVGQMEKGDGKRARRVWRK